MTTFLYIVIYLYCIFILSCNSGSHNSNQKISNIFWQDTVINLGNINKDTSYKFEFIYIIRNSPNLIFKKVETSCGCTIVSLDDTSKIQLNKKYKLSGELNTHELNGEIDKAIYILTNAQPEFHLLKIKANVK